MLSTSHSLFLALCMAILCFTAAKVSKPFIMRQFSSYPQGTLTLVRIPDSTIQLGKLSIEVSKKLKSVPQFSINSPNSIVFNAGYFDPVNGLTTAYFFDKGNIQLDPQDNPNLLENPKLKPFLSAIFNRSEFRILSCLVMGNKYTTRLQIARHRADLPQNCALKQSIGAGPSLDILPDDTEKTLQEKLFKQLLDEAFIAQNAAGQMIRDPLGFQRPNARSALFIDEHEDLSLVLASAQSGPGYTLMDVIRFVQQKGAKKLLFLDGGSSSGLWAKQQFYPGLHDKKGKAIIRPVLSVLKLEL
jgi:hypothetical protein